MKSSFATIAFLFFVLSSYAQAGNSREKAHALIKQLEGNWTFALYSGDTTKKKPTRTGKAIYQFVHDSFSMAYRIEMTEVKVVTNGLMGYDTAKEQYFDISMNNSRVKMPVAIMGMPDSAGYKIIYPTDDAIVDKTILEILKPGLFQLYPFNIKSGKILWRMVFTKQ
jgi:hypothetical protein